jgi:NADH:ubiquinone oxidoreductase subunit F (NADH-binding)
MTPIDQPKCIVCNALDVDPGSRSAAAILARDLDAVLEGLLIIGRQIGAGRAYICLDADDEESATAVKAALESSIGEMEIGVVGLRVSLVLWDETALLRALEGRQPIPVVDALSSADRTFQGQPVVVHSVETLARLAQGEPSVRTLTVWWQGEAHVVEAPLGTTLRAVARETTGAEPEADRVRAVLFGGATGRFYDISAFDLPVGPEAEQPCGVLEVIPAGACGVELARDALRYLSGESCGACVACREGTRQVADILEDVVAFRAGAADMELMLRLAEAMREGSICDLGRHASAPLLSSLEVFAADFAAHIDDKRCLGVDSDG